MSSDQSLPKLSPRDLIRTFPDFPRPGIRFRDVTPLLTSQAAFHFVTMDLAYYFHGRRIDKVVGLEARGFIFGASVARLLRTGFVPFRKPGKLPGPVTGWDYGLEYGKDRLEMQDDAIQEGDHLLIVDDLLATGGTASAAIQLSKMKNAEIVGCSFVVELLGLSGRTKIEELGYEVHSTYSFCEDE